MEYGFLSLQKAAAHVHINERELLHFAQREEVPAVKRGDEYVFEERLLDEWLQRHLLELSKKELSRQHREVTSSLANGYDMSVSRLVERGAIAEITSKTKGGVIRDMADLADATGFVYDPDAYYHGLVAREETASTAVDCGTAFLHAKFHDPYHASDSFICVGRAVQPIFFGAPNDEPTDIFFLICCIDNNEHIHTLTRLATMALRTKMLEDIRTAEDVEAIRNAIIDAERQLLDGMK